MPPRRNDLTFYDRMADHWWDESAKIYALHHLNPLWFNYFDSLHLKLERFASTGCRLRGRLYVRVSGSTGSDRAGN